MNFWFSYTLIANSNKLSIKIGQMEKNNSFNYHTKLENELQNPINGDCGLELNYRRFAFSHQPSFQHYHGSRSPISNLNNLSIDSLVVARPFLSHNVSSIDIPPSEAYTIEENVNFLGWKRSFGWEFTGFVDFGFGVSDLEVCLIMNLSLNFLYWI